MAPLEDLIQDLVKRGELSYLSLAKNSAGVWVAVFTPCSEYGSVVLGHSDPVLALKQALSARKLKSKPAKIPDSEIDLSDIL